MIITLDVDKSDVVADGVGVRVDAVVEVADCFSWTRCGDGDVVDDLSACSDDGESGGEDEGEGTFECGVWVVFDDWEEMTVSRVSLCGWGCGNEAGGGNTEEGSGKA